jgi:arsenate reductase (thioredoxin)
MSEKFYNVLFVCMGNSARSILAEALLNELGRGRFQAFSAGSHPVGLVNPRALTTLSEMGMPTGKPRSKNWNELAVSGAPEMDFVITVCDGAAGEVCPIYPGQPVTAHWGVPDPAAVRGSEEEKRVAFRDAAVTLKRRIDLMLALPLSKLDVTAIKRELRDIGER